LQFREVDILPSLAGLLVLLQISHSNAPISALPRLKALTRATSSIIAVSINHNKVDLMSALDKVLLLILGVESFFFFSKYCSEIETLRVISE
jgi:hypothetical protein